MECLFHNNEDKKREESFKMQYLKLFDWIESLVSAKLNESLVIRYQIILPFLPFFRGMSVLR